VTGLRIGISGIDTRQRLYRFHMGSEVHPAPCSMDTVDPSPDATLAKACNSPQNSKKHQKLRNA